MAFKKFLGHHVPMCWGIVSTMSLVYFKKSDKRVVCSGMGVCMVRHKKAAVSHLRNCVSCSLPPVCDSMCEAVLELILDKNTTYLQILQ